MAAKYARVERWAEDSGNAALAGHELPPAEVLAVDQRITGWARELHKSGLEGDMDMIRARAYLDLQPYEAGGRTCRCTAARRPA